MTSEQEFSSRSRNLDNARNIIDTVDGASIPQYAELPYSTFASVEPFPEDVLNETPRPDFNKPPSEAVDHYYSELNERELTERIKNYVGPILDNAPVIIRCAPIVPNERAHLSFAGTYPSFVPKPFPQSMESVDIAVASVLAGKHTRYAEYYHRRHEIPARRLGVLAMELVNNPAIHGTVYSMDHNVRSEHVFDPSLGEEQFGAYHFAKDKFGDTGSADSDEFCSEINFVGRLTDITRKLEDSFGHAIDMEYLVDKEGTIHIVQIRGMSRDHISNWKKYYTQSPQDIAITPDVERRAIINSVGKFQGQAVTYNNERPLRIADNGIQLIDHELSCNFLERLNKESFSAKSDVIISHGADRIRDHLQYAILEDPAVSNLAHIDSNEAVISAGREVNVYSNGDRFIRLK